MLDLGFDVRELADVPAYQRGKAPSLDTNTVKMSSNENPWAREWLNSKLALVGGLDHSRYPNDVYPELRHQISNIESIDDNRIFIGSGSSEVLGIAARAFLGPDNAVIQSRYTFPLFGIKAQLCGARIIRVDDGTFRHSIEKLISNIVPRKSIVYVDNPCNPSGSILNGKEIAELVDATRGSALLIVDEAYDGLISSPLYKTAVAHCARENHVMVIRTLSKSYGLAGARIGYGMTSPHLVDIMERFRLPFNVSSISGALASLALLDAEFPNRCSDYVKREMRLMIADSIVNQNLVCEAYANYFCMRFKNAEFIEKSLLSNGISVKRLQDDPTLIRVSLGLANQNILFREALRRAINTGDRE